MRIKAKGSGRVGGAAVELAVLASLLLILLLGVWEVGRLVEVKHLLTNAAREGARQAATGQSDSGVRQAVLTYMGNAGLPTANAVVPNPTRTVEASGETSVRVTVSLPFRDVRWTKLSLVTDSNTLVTAKSTWYAE